MRYKRKLWGTGHIRIIKRFAFFPISIGEDVRWLETVMIEQEIHHFTYYGYEWVNKKFIELPK